MKKLIVSLSLLVLLPGYNIGRAQSGSSPVEWKGPHTLQTLGSAPVALIPFPKKVQWSKERFVVSKNTVVQYAQNDAAAAANAIRSLEELFSAYGIELKQVVSKPGGVESKGIRLQINQSLPLKREGYELKVTGHTVVITARDAAGLYYGVQTLRQLLQEKSGGLQLPGCVITDWPAFGLRGFMHDNGRNFQSIEMLKGQLDTLSHYKYNTFHWHLTDNPAWRPQSRRYPQLNDAKSRQAGRDPDSTYSFDYIRELIGYARERCITIIPELDMPGHSQYFRLTFGFPMESEQGMQVLGDLIDEFCKEIPAEDCPIIHLGSDEVHIPNPKEFIGRMTARVRANGRRVMVWNPGLPPLPGTLEQVWRDEGTSGERKSDNPYVDSYAGYLNSYDALSLVQRYFFHQVCGKPQGDSLALGGILCCWPDTRVDDKAKIALYNPVWPGALTFSEAVWCGRPVDGAGHTSALPAKGTTAYRQFEEFENRLSRHRDRFFREQYFPYAQFGHVEWELSGPYRRSKGQPLETAFAPERETPAAADTATSVNITGGVVRLEGRIDGKLLSNDANETIYLTAYIHAGAARQIRAWTGFEVAVRSNRRSAGIPPNGKWDASGGAVFLNGEELKGPQWMNPGGNRYLQPTWNAPANEIPYTDEEFYWSRPPMVLSLKKGWNKLVVRVPRSYRDQAWMFAFVPVKRVGGRWVEDLSVKLVPNSPSHR